jgi:2-polyprenyl-3-methyl-5-hydroxy-6-metoxy-1,4-benzoquinol methylase
LTAAGSKARGTDATGIADMGATIRMACDLCNGQAHRLLFVKEGFSHVRCRDCGLVFVNPRLRNHIRGQIEGGTGAMGSDRLSPREQRHLERELKIMAPFRRTGRVLEIGAGFGWFLSAAARAGWETWALEVNRRALTRLARRGLDRIVDLPAEDFRAPARSMDAVRLWEVIEHLQSPRTVLHNSYEALRPGGLLRLSTPNFASWSHRICGPNWIYLNGADHIHLFEPATIARLLRRIGFDRIRIRTRAFKPERRCYHPPRRLPPPGRMIHAFRNLIHEMVRFTSFGHEMIVTAVKPAGDGSAKPVIRKVL